MKNLLILFFLGLSIFSTSQSIEGNWYGTLPAGETEQIVEFVMIKSGSEYEVSINSMGMNFKADSVVVSNSDFFIKFSFIGADYRGKIFTDSLSGKFRQRGFEIPLTLTSIKPVVSHKKVEKKERPQTPKPPFNYYTEELTIKNKVDTVSLSGTLTLPTNDGTKYSVVVLISGSGAQNRDSEIFGHKSFAVIADHLAGQGIGSFRYDERGVGKSTGIYGKGGLYGLYSDLEAIVTQLSTQKNIGKIGLAGHSEGGILAPWYASEHKKQIDFVIMMAAPGMPIKEMMILQRKLLAESVGQSKEMREANENLMTRINEIVITNSGETKTKLIVKELTNFATKSGIPQSVINNFVQGQLLMIDSEIYKDFIQIQPESYLKNVKCPTLVLQGSKDKQVAEKENIEAIKKSLKKKKICGTKPVYIIYPNVNHLFQPCETGNIEEYESIETTIDRKVLFDISEFINEL